MPWAAGHLVILLLTPQRLRIRFYMPQAVHPRLKPGQMVRLSCYGFAEALALAVIMLVVMMFAVLRFRRTLD